MKQHNDKNLLPLLIDLTNPSPALGWANQERNSYIDRGPVDLVIALALIHHLAISNNVPLPLVAQFFASIGRWALVEFVPKADSQVQRLLASRKDIFDTYNEAGFETAFQDCFELVEKVPLSGTQRTSTSLSGVPDPVFHLVGFQGCLQKLTLTPTFWEDTKNLSEKVF